MWFLCDFDYTYIPKDKWAQIPLGLRRKIRAIEEKGGDLQNVYQQARRYVDFAQERNKKKWAVTVASVKAQDIGGTPAGKWSAVKASIAVRRYKDSGGKYKTKQRGMLGKANWFQQQKQKGG